MTGLFFYVIVAVLTLVVAVLLARQGSNKFDAETEAERIFNHGLLDRPCLDLAERIFDPADYRWLREELGFPQLAEDLACQRKEMALRWLKGLRGAFNDLVSEPHASGPGDTDDGRPAWAMAILTLRFHALLSFAILMVWMFGPYHRMIPSFGWLRAASNAKFRKDRYEMVNPN